MLLESLGVCFGGEIMEPVLLDQLGGGDLGCEGKAGLARWGM